MTEKEEEKEKLLTPLNSIVFSVYINNVNIIAIYNKRAIFIHL